LDGRCLFLWVLPDIPYAVATHSYTVYLLECSDGSLYTGITNDLAARLHTHNQGRGARYTRARLPVKVVWSKSRQHPTDARRLEYAVKQLSRAEKLALVAGDQALWRQLRSRTLTR
jgi:putative endonuclease